MIIEFRTVTVLHTPAQITPRTQAYFMDELMGCLERGRPRIVLDCSTVRRMNKEMILLLLSCLEEAMKRNGNVKLSALRPVAEAVLRYAGLHRMFEIFSTTAQAEQSYQRQSAQRVPQSAQSLPMLPHSTDGNAESMLEQSELQPARG